MSNRKITPETEAEEEALELDIIETGDVVEAPAEPDPRPEFPPPPVHGSVIEGTWNGLPNFLCSACGFADLDRAITEAHCNRPAL
jgi:hypothetical protein